MARHKNSPPRGRDAPVGGTGRLEHRAVNNPPPFLQPPRPPAPAAPRRPALLPWGRPRRQQQLQRFLCCNRRCRRRGRAPCAPSCASQEFSLIKHTHAGFYKNSGYLLISCNDGLNQMRAAICDMVTVARYLNLTMVVPELDKQSFWADPSDFGDIFGVNDFINSLQDEVKIIRELPQKFRTKVPFSMQPISWSSEKYYLRQILPLVWKHKVVRFSRTDSRLANNGLPLKLQKLRCHVNYHALQFAPSIEALGKKMIAVLRKTGYFIVLHLRYEMDMLAFSCCTHGCSDEETAELTRMRYAYPWWKEKEIDSEKKRLEGLCPLTPGETTLVLKALGFPRDTRIYIASGEIYGGEKRLAALKTEFPIIVRKEMLFLLMSYTPSRSIRLKWQPWTILFLLLVMSLFPAMMETWLRLWKDTTGLWAFTQPYSWRGKSLLSL